MWRQQQQNPEKQTLINIDSSKATSSIPDSQTYVVHATRPVLWFLWCWLVDFVAGWKKSSDTWPGYIFELFLAIKTKQR